MSTSDKIRQSSSLTEALEYLAKDSHMMGNFVPWLDHPLVQYGYFVKIKPEYLRKYGQMNQDIYRVVMVLHCRKDAIYNGYLWLAENNANPYVSDVEVVSEGFL